MEQEAADLAAAGRASEHDSTAGTEGISCLLMSKIASIHWKKFEKFLLAIGCRFTRQESSHRIYWKEGLSRPVVITCHGSLPVFIIRKNLKTLGIEPEDYVRLLKEKA